MSWPLAAGVAILLAAPARALKPAVDLRTDGPGLYHVEAVFTAAAPASQAWTVITDYDDIGRFVSSVVKSRVVGKRADGSLIVEQTGKGRLWLFSKKIDMKLAVFETPPFDVQFESVSSDGFDEYQGSWRIEPEGERCLVRYSLTARPKPSLGPPFAARRALEKNVASQLEQVDREIERRAKAR